MIEELEVVALTRDIPDAHLKKGDVGTVVHVHLGGKAYMVEFVLQTGFMAALEDIEASGVRSLEEGELDRERYREWKQEWTGVLGDVPPVSELPEWDISVVGHCPDAHYLAYVDGAEVRAD